MLDAFLVLGLVRVNRVRLAACAPTHAAVGNVGQLDQVHGHVSGVVIGATLSTDSISKPGDLDERVT